MPDHLWSGTLDAKTFESRVDQLLANAQAAVDRMLSVEGKRTLENTLAPFDEAVEQIDSAANHAQLLQAVHADSAVRDAGQKMIQKVSAVQTALSLNQGVYRALAAVDPGTADPATRYYLERQLLLFRLAGVDRDEATRVRIKQLNDEMTQLGTTLHRNLAEDVRTIAVRDRSELDGLPADYIARHAPATDGTITLTTEPPDVFPVMKFAKSAELRRRVYLTYTSRGYPQNQPLLTELLRKRAELAAVLGFANWADMNAADKMARNARSIADFIDQLDTASRATAGREYTMMLAAARRDNPKLAAISASDTSYWNEQVKRAEFDFDSQSARPYFPYERVQQGILDTAAKLFRVSIRPASGNVSAWNPAVTVWDVYDGSRHLGRFYLDMHPRAGKDKWFAMYPILDGKVAPSGKRQLPEAALICNFAGGKPDDPGLMEYGDVVTFFHEFGHLMHWIFQGQQRWAGFAGMMESDFVEAPSQMLEEWMHDPAVLATFARHYQTNQPISAEMVKRMNRADAFGRGLWTRRQLSLTAISLVLHEYSAPPPQQTNERLLGTPAPPPQQTNEHLLGTPAPTAGGNGKPAATSASAPLKSDELERTYFAQWKRFLPYQPLEGDHMITSFGHLVGYSSAYYTYLWDKVIAEDFFAQFDRSNLLAGETPLRYRTTVLEATGAMPANDIVKKFLGRPQSVDALVRWMNEEFEGQPQPAKLR